MMLQLVAIQDNVKIYDDPSIVKLKVTEKGL